MVQRFGVEKDVLWRKIIVEKIGETFTGRETVQPKGPKGGSLWTNIYKELKDFNKGIRFKIGTGKKTRFWEDSWLGEGRLCDMFPLAYEASRTKEFVVASMYEVGEDCLSWGFMSRQRYSHTISREVTTMSNLLSSISIQEGVLDSRVWVGSIHGHYMVKDGIRRDGDQGKTLPQDYDCEMGGGKGPKLKRIRKPTALKSNICIPEFEIFPPEEKIVDQGIKDTPIPASAVSSDTVQTISTLANTPLLTNTDTIQNDKDIPNSANFTIPFPSISDSPSSSSSFLLEPLYLDKKALDSIRFSSQTLLGIIDSAQSSTNDPHQLRICSALSKLLCGFPSDKATRDEIQSQIDPSFNTALDVLESHRQMILAEGRFESSCSQLEISYQNTLLEKEVSRLKGELQVAVLDSEGLRNENQKLRDLNQKRVVERFTFQFLAEDTHANNEKLQIQLNQLNNQHSYSLDQINNLTHENSHLTREIKILNAQISHLSELLYSADLRYQTLSEEIHSLSMEKGSFLKKEAMFPRQYLILQKINDDQEQALRSLEVQYEASFKELNIHNKKIIQSKVNLTVKMNQLQEQYDQLKHSHDVLKKKNNSLSADEKKIRSRLNGLVGDDFDKAMGSLKNNTLAFSKLCEGSEKSNQSTISQLRFDLAKVRKDRANLEISYTNLEVSLTASRDRARRRFIFLQNFMEMNARNIEKEVIRKAHVNAQTLVNQILLRNSLSRVTVPPLNISEDEKYPEPDSDYEFVSEDERDHEDNIDVSFSEDQLKKDKSGNVDSVDKADAEVKDPNPIHKIDAEKSLVEQDVPSGNA
ncbi:spindle pole body component 110-like [Papaver somniferum]|uniref:spindle pole body component 110-like n=1 Tax=Papaver somniferum TaxID=3469 RepID=UPI000E7021F7|nr:spindle pole body component 110-like [Papaver somniferum]